MIGLHARRSTVDDRSEIKHTFTGWSSETSSLDLEPIAKKKKKVEMKLSPSCVRSTDKFSLNSGMPGHACQAYFSKVGSSGRSLAGVVCDKAFSIPFSLLIDCLFQSQDQIPFPFA
jgi:hypothetical protein